MPVPRNELKNGKAIGSLQKRILEFLSKHRDSAYTHLEIIRELIKLDENIDADVLREVIFGASYASVSASLDVLLEQNKVVGKIVQVGSVREVYFTVP